MQGACNQAQAMAQIIEDKVAKAYREKTGEDS